MKLEFYDKSRPVGKQWREGNLAEATIKTADETVTVYGDNVRLPSFPTRCPVCGKDDDWKISEMLMGGFLFCVGAAIIVIAITHVISLFR